MRRSECVKLLTAIAAVFPTFAVDEERAAVWFDLIGDLEYPVADLALRKVLATAKFIPTIAEIREAAASLEGPDEITPGEAWGELMAAVRRFYVTDAEEAYASLRPSVARVARILGWREIYLADNIEALRAHFMQIFQSLAERERREARLPPALRRTGEAGRLGDGRSIARPLGERERGVDVSRHLAQLPVGKEDR